MHRCLCVCVKFRRYHPSPSIPPRPFLSHPSFFVHPSPSIISPSIPLPAIPPRPSSSVHPSSYSPLRSFLSIHPLLLCVRCLCAYEVREVSALPYQYISVSIPFLTISLPLLLFIPSSYPPLHSPSLNRCPYYCSLPTRVCE